MIVRSEPPMSGPANMAADIALIEVAEAGEVAARVYAWEGPWVSLGKFQSPDVDLIGPIPHVIRPTGGKAVLHGHDATIGLAVPLGMLDCTSRDVKKAYRSVSVPIVAALRACGLNAKLAEETRFVGTGARTADCFAFNSPNDIVDADTGKKVCGCALVLSHSTLLLQASIPCGEPLIDPRTVLRQASDYIGSEWDTTTFPDALEQALRYNFPHV